MRKWGKPELTETRIITSAVRQLIMGIKVADAADEIKMATNVMITKNNTAAQKLTS